MRVNFGAIRTVATRFTRFAYCSIVPKERVEGLVLLDFFVTFFIKKESLDTIKLLIIIWVSYPDSGALP
jgi:hypothetical protein